MDLDTTQAGGRSYPEPPEDKSKCYTFICECSTKARISVWAENLEEAENRIKFGYYDACEQVNNLEVEDILSYEIES